MQNEHGMKTSKMYADCLTERNTQQCALLKRQQL